jgi:hypothetical protein
MIVARFSAQCALVVIAAIALALPFSAARPAGAELMQQSWLPVPAGRFNHARVPVVLGKDRPSRRREGRLTPLPTAGIDFARYRHAGCRAVRLRFETIGGDRRVGWRRTK